MLWKTFWSQRYLNLVYSKINILLGYGFAGGSSFLTTGIYNELTLIEKPALSNSSSIVSSPNSFPNTPDTNSTSIESQPAPPFPPRSLRNYPSVEQEVSTFKADSPMTTFPRPSPRSLFATPSPRRFHIEQEKCLRCKKSVYAAEQVSLFYSTRCLSILGYCCWW